MSAESNNIGNWYTIVDAPNCYCRREGQNAVLLMPGPLIIVLARKMAQTVGLKSGAKLETDAKLEQCAIHARARKEGRMLFAVQAMKS